MNLDKNQKFKKILHYVLNGIISTFMIAYFGFTILPVAILRKPIITLAKFIIKLLSPVLEEAANPTYLYSPYAILCLLLLLMFFIIKPLRKYLKALGRSSKGNTSKMLLYGLLLGFIMNGQCIFIAYINGNIHLEYSQFEPIKLIIIFIFVFLQCAYEEIISRCFIYQRLKHTYNPTVAIIASAIYFSLIHIFNSGISLLAIVSLTLVGILYVLFVHYFDSIWISFGAHAAWNFTQNFLFGLPNSGVVSTYSVFKLINETTSGFAYDKVFGVEGSLFCTLIYIIAIAVVIYYGNKHKVIPLDIFQDANKNNVE